MKKLLVMLFLMLPVGAFAMSCPSNSSIIEKGDTLQEVLQRCGEPASQHNFENEMPVKNQLTYRDGDMTFKHSVTRIHHQDITELAYNGSRLSPSTLRFENNRLVDWE
jgi:hypothetical protein